MGTVGLLRFFAKSKIHSFNNLQALFTILSILDNPKQIVYFHLEKHAPVSAIILSAIEISGVQNSATECTYC